MTNEIPQAPFTTPPYFPSTFPERKPKSNLVKIIIGVIIVLIIGAGISLAARIWDPLWNPFRPEPEKVIEKMSQKMAEVKILRSEIKLDLGAKEDTKETFKMTMSFSSDSDVTDSKNPKSTGDFNMAMTFNGVQISLAGETITIGDISYFKLTTIPAFPFFEMMGIDASQMQNQWIKYDEESYLKAMYGGEIPPEMAEEMKKSKEKEEEMIKKLETIFKDKKLYIVKKELPDEKIGNVKTYHYLVALNKEEIRKLIPELFKAMQEFSLPAPSLSETEFEEIFPEIDKFFEKIDEITVEIWIGKKDNYLYKIKGEKEIDMSKFREEAKGKMTIKAEIDFSNFNQPVKIEAPEKYKSIEEVIYPFIGQALEGARSRNRDAIRKNDLHQISVAMEMYYGEKSKYPQSINTLTVEKYLQFVPTDPGDGPCPGPYKWISNLKNTQKYCVYACLETGKFYAISHKGDQELQNAPVNLDCW